MTTVTNENILNQLCQFQIHTHDRAKECLSALTSPERICLEHIILNTYVDSDNLYKVSLSGKLSLINQMAMDGEAEILAPIPRTKDEGVNCLMLMIINVWRAIKNVFGGRISSDELFDRVNRFTAQTRLDYEKAGILFTLNESVILPEQALLATINKFKNNEDFSAPIFNFIELYEALGLDEGDSLENAEHAYFNILLSEATQVKKEEAKMAYHILYLFEQIKPTCFPTEDVARSLEGGINSFYSTLIPHEDGSNANRDLSTLCMLYALKTGQLD